MNDVKGPGRNRPGNNREISARKETKFGWVYHREPVARRMTDAWLKGERVRGSCEGGAALKTFTADAPVGLVRSQGPCKFQHHQEEIMTVFCPLCGNNEHLVGDEDLGTDGMFYSCRGHEGGCGSTFRVTPDGECVDIF